MIVNAANQAVCLVTGVGPGTGDAIARTIGPKGVHVAYVLIDAVIDLAWIRARWPERPDDFFIKPSAIAEEIWHVVHQARSAWSFNVGVRPFGESW